MDSRHIEHCGATGSTGLFDTGSARLVAAAAPISSSSQPIVKLQPGKSPDFLAVRPRLVSSERVGTISAPTAAFSAPAFIRFLDLPIRSVDLRKGPNSGHAKGSLDRGLYQCQAVRHTVGISTASLIIVTTLRRAILD